MIKVCKCVYECETVEEMMKFFNETKEPGYHVAVDVTNGFMFNLLGEKEPVENTEIVAELKVKEV